MRAVHVPAAGGDFELITRDIPEPGRDEVRIRVQACGICHSDAMVKLGHWPGVVYPRVPGHESVGVVDAVGPDATPWKVGARVGVGWFGGCCFHCDPCRRGDFLHCTSGQIPGMTYDGGYADYMIAPAGALALVPGDNQATYRVREQLARLSFPSDAVGSTTNVTGTIVAFYPSPAGATESELDQDAWNDIVAENPLLANLMPDVEALLVNRMSGARDYFLAPIDECYKLTGIVRIHWRGFSGGDEGLDRFRQFFDGLKERSYSPSGTQYAGTLV